MKAAVDLQNKLLDVRLLAYAMAGVGCAALLPAAGAEVVYTPTDIRLNHGLLALDLNNDNSADFILANHESYSSPGYPIAFLKLQKAAKDSENAVLEGKVGGALAIASGQPVGPDSPKSFVVPRSKGEFMADAFCYPLAGMASPPSCRVYGVWANVADKYLGLKFQINGETHYGWARLAVVVETAKFPFVHATLTGYAYETTADTTITTGDTGTSSGTEDSHASRSLGSLSRGFAEMNSRRQK